MSKKKLSSSKRPPKGKSTSFNGFNKKSDKPLPDTSRIPWSQPMPKKTGRR